MEIDPSTMSASQLYRLMIGVIVPRPIAWVSTRGRDGSVNLAPFSFFNGVCAQPPVLSLSFGYREGRKKDTLLNIEATREFTVSVVPAALAKAMNLTSADYPPGISEADMVGVIMTPATKVAAPRVAASPAALECRLFQTLPVGSPPGGAVLVLGEIVHVYLADEQWTGGAVDGRALDAVGRMGGHWYCHTHETFYMARPKI